MASAGVTLEQLWEMPLTLSVEQAGRCLGLSRNVAFQMAAEDRFPVPILQLGSKRVVLKSEVARFLGVELPAADPLTMLTQVARYLGVEVAPSQLPGLLSAVAEHLGVDESTVRQRAA